MRRTILASSSPVPWSVQSAPLSETYGSRTRSLRWAIGSVLLISLITGLTAPEILWAQGTAPTNPAKEYIYSGDKLVATVELPPPPPTITGISPAAGAVGTAVTISGVSFGPTQGIGFVTFNGVSATPSSWTATSITAPVPTGATTGPITVNVGGASSNSVTFTVTTAPTISGLTPAAGPVAASVIIAGSNFGATKGTSTVKFNGITATTTSWGSTSITATVPSGATTGSVVVTVGGVASNGVTFTVATVPTITAVTPTVGPIGAAVTVSGNNFGATQGGSAIKFNGVTATPTSWNATTIGAPVPTGATTGPVTVTVGANTSNGVTFTVTSTPTITSLNPSSGPVGTTVTVAGTNFGATQGTSTVTFNGVAASPSSWSATSITTTVPAGATTGSVVVTVSGTGSNGVTFTMTTAPVITSLNPAVGPVGTSVTITGSNFGATQGTSTIKFNGTTATPTSWNNTTIVAPVPAGATTGPVVVTVNGTASNGVTFSVGSAPTVTLTSPANGAVYQAPAAIILSATASDPGGSISKVEFFWGIGSLIGTVTTSPYNFTWSNVAAGNYSIKAVATDNSGLTTTSNIAAIVVGYPPQITLTSPGGAAFGAPANILLNATVTDSDNAISKVEFFQGSNLIGTVTSAPSNGPYSYTWQNVPVGSYTVTAKATDVTGLSTVSAAANISVGTAPTVSLTSPANGTTLVAPVATVSLAATASDPDGSISRVEFWSGSTLMIGWDDTAPYTYNWNNVGVGIYALTAKAIDNQGITVSSAEVFLNVTTPPGSCIGVGCGSYSGSGNPGYAEGIGTGAVWNHPHDGVVAKDPVSGQVSLFVADTENHRIRMIYLDGGTSGQSVLIAGNGTAGYYEGGGNALNAYYNHPRGITATTDANGVVTALYVIDTDNQVIRKLLPPTSTYWRSQFYSGTVGSAGFVNGTATQSKYSYPRSAVPSGSYIYVAGGSNFAVRKLDSAGASSTFATGGEFNGITVSKTTGMFYATSYGTNHVRQITTSGTTSIIAGISTSTGAFADGIGSAARFYWPYHLTWDNPAEGEVLYVADEANQRIRKILLSTTEVTTPAGSLAGYQDGCKPNIWFHEPESVALGPTGELYVVDGTNNRIRLLNLNPPNAPTSLTATPISTTRIDLAWIDNTNNEDGFKVERSTDGTNFSLLVTLGANVTSYPDTGLTANTTYYYRVFAYNNTLGNTSYSSAVRASTLGNNLPTVSLTGPSNGALYTAPANITINATASDSDGTISKVEFFNGGALLATDTTSPYSYAWNSVAAGSYTISAKATDNTGGTAISFVDIIVNAAPTVSITSPSGGASFAAPVNLTLTANASDSDGTISKVEFFKSSTKLGEVNTSPYSFLWSNVWGGSYSLTAKATDNRGTVTTSSAVNITVTGNSAPTVSITSPANGASFTAPANITINATASDSGGSVTKVEFFQNGVSLGQDTSSPYSFSWSGVAVGSYILTAVATDNGGATTTSSPASIDVH